MIEVWQAQSDYPDASTPMSVEQKPNLLVLAATPLMTLITQIKHTVEHPQVSTLQSQIVEEIKLFEALLRENRYPLRSLMAARYALCTAMDEAVLSRPWGAHSLWAQQSLLSIFHKETWGGERFYLILEDMAKNPRKNIDFLEFAYYLLSLGYEGKFFGQQVSIREEIRNRIFYRIRYSRSKPDRRLSADPEKLPAAVNLSSQAALRKLALLTTAILLALMLYFNLLTDHAAQAVFRELAPIAEVSPITTFSQVLPRPLIQRGLNP